MTPEQIEAKALEEFPDRAGDDKTILATLSSAFSEARREGFIKGCQYAATPSAEINVLFDDIMLSVRQLSLFAGKSGANVTYRLIEALKHLQAASLSPAQPIRPAESPDAGREEEQSGQQFNAAVFAEAMCNHAYRMAAGFGLGEGIQWHDLSEIEKQWTIAAASEAFTEVTPADPGSQVEAADPVISGAIDLIKTYQERAEIQNMALNLKLIATYHKKTK